MQRRPDPHLLPPVLYRFIEILLVLLTLCLGAEAISRRVFGLHGLPYATPFLEEYFPDFLSFIPRFKFFHSPLFFSSTSTFPFMYPAPVAVVYKLFYLIPGSPLAAFLLTGLIAAAVGVMIFARNLRSRGIIARDAYLFPICVLLCSSPFWFAARQANMEIVMWIITAAGLCLFLSGRGYSAAACFGIVASMKIYPFVYFGLLFTRRQYRQIFFGVLVIAGVTLTSLWLTSPDIANAWRSTSHNIDIFRYFYMLRIRREIGFDHSLFAVIKLLLQPLPPLPIVGKILSLYLSIAAIGGLLLFFLRIRFLPLLNQIVCLTIALVFLPPVSFEYTLLHLFVPLALLVLLTVESCRLGQTVPGLKFALGCFVVLLAFIPEIIYRGHSYGGQIKAVFLLILFAIALRYPLALTSPPDKPDRNDNS